MDKGEIMWWTGIKIFFGCIGTMVLSVMMLIHIGSETDPWAIFWFLVFVVAASVLIFVFGEKDSIVSQPQQRARIVFREQQPKQPKPIPMNLKRCKEKMP